MINEVFGNSPEAIAARLNEPKVHDELGIFKKLNKKVVKTSNPAYWRTENIELYKPQTQELHDDLLNTYYDQRGQLPNWKELGQDAEKEAPNYNSKDETFRGNESVKSSLVENIQYDPTMNRAIITMHGNSYEYAATPQQLQNFMNAGSLGKEINNIKKGAVTSMTKLPRPNTKIISLNDIFSNK